MKEEEQEVQQPELRSPGKMLKEARLAHQLTAKQVATRLNLREYMIDELEADQYDSKISVTFTKGYLKTYAKLVKISEQEVLDAFDQINRMSKEPAKLQSFSRRVARQASDDRLMMVTYAILAILIALSVMWWLQQSGEEEVTDKSYPNTQTEKNLQIEQQADEIVQQASDDESLPVETSDMGAEPELGSVSLDNEAADMEEPPRPAGLPSNDDNTQPLVESLNESRAQQPTIQEPSSQSDKWAAPVELVFEFAEDCWINIEDDTGEAIAYGIKVQGRVMPVTGVPPFNVTVAVPESVKISYDGEEVDMSGFPAGRTARFTLPLQE